MGKYRDKEEVIVQIAICDDNREYLNVAEDYFNKLTDNKFDYDVFECGEDLLNMYETEKANYDAIFLDMEMKDLDGIETANIIREKDKHVIIVFVTSHTKYMKDSFKCSPFRFLVKPLEWEEFKTVFDEVCLKVRNERTTFVFTEKRNSIRLFCDDIVYFESQSHWIWIHTKEKTYKICKSFSHLDSKLDKNTFCRIHKSFIVNLGHIKEITNNDVVLHNYNKSIPVSRSYKKTLIDEFLKFAERNYFI